MMPDGSLYLLGSIQANGFSNGNLDLFVMQLTLAGETKFVEYIGAGNIETPGDIVYNFLVEKAYVFGYTESSAFKSQGGSDWFVFMLDKYGRNQCTNLGINNVTTSLAFKSASLTFRKITPTLNTVGSPSSSTITTLGTLQSIIPTSNTFCPNFAPVLPEEAILNTTVIENTYMTYVLPKFCDDQTADLTYTLKKASGGTLDSWMIWDGISRTV